MDKIDGKTHKETTKIKTSPGNESSRGSPRTERRAFNPSLMQITKEEIDAGAAHFAESLRLNPNP